MQAQVEDLTNLSLEQLMQVKVTTAAKTPETLMHTAAAAYVITQEDIQRSGATNIPELLRMVPGIDVAQVNANTYAITARGFNGVYANKLLVLIDGRSVYTPLFSGVQWDLQDVLLQDIDRIEIVRGPGGTLWGANAFNGVINIITKNANETQGGLVGGLAGSVQDGGFTRYGGKLDPDTAFRVWGKIDHRGDDSTASGLSARDGYDFGRAGFRVDSARGQDTNLMFEGGFTRGAEGEIFQHLTPTFPFTPFQAPGTETPSAAHLLARATKDTGGGSEWQLQSYLDWTDRNLTILEEKRLTADIELQHSSHPIDGHHLIWGLGYRASADRTQGTFDLSLNPSSDTEHLANFFVQDEITLVPKTLTLTLGSKFEYTNWSGFDVQPNIRLLWKPTEQQAVWAAVSRAVRTPSRAERDLAFNYGVLSPPLVPIPTLVKVLGNPAMESEKVTAFETGYRWQPTQRINLDLSTYYNIYRQLETADPQSPTLIGGLPVVPVQFGANNAAGHSIGAELAVGWQPTSWLTLRSAYTYQETKLFRLNGSLDTLSVAYQNSAPKHEVYTRASINFSPTVKWDVSARYVGRLNLGAADSALLTLPNVKSYWALDMRLGWQATDRLLLELIGQNLNRDKHIEFQDFGPTRAATAEIPRAVIARATISF